MKKSLFLAIAFSSLVAAPALATDLAIPRKAPVYVPPPPPPPTWSSCYIGGEGGGLWANRNWIDNDLGSPFFGESFGSQTVSSWLAGIQAGCDWQFSGPWVVGIQADYDWSNAKASNANLILVPGDLIDESRIKSVGSATVRLGYSWDSFLGYVKGGAAWEHDEFTIFDASTFSATGVNPRYGWTVGVGGEYLFTPWLSGFIEYDYYGFSNRDFTFFLVDGLHSVDMHENKNVAKAGLNFRFSNWWGRY